MRFLAVMWLVACAEPAPHPYAPPGYPLVVADRIVQAPAPADAAIARTPPEPFLGEVTQLSVGPGKRATRAIAVGDSPVCALDSAGALDCFLSDEGGLTDSAVAESWATKAVGPHPIVGVDHAIAVGVARGRDIFGCALRESRDANGAQVFCWGDNESGELGNGVETRSSAAVAVLGATTD